MSIANEASTKLEFLPEKRNIPQLNFLPKKEYNIYSNLINFETILFSDNISYDDYIHQINQLISQNIKNERFIDYVINCLLYFIVIRPKQIKLPCEFLKTLCSPSTWCRIQESILFNNLLYYSIIQDVLYLEYIIDFEPIGFNKREYTILSIYPEDSIEYILKEDDLNQLKIFISSQDKIYPKIKIDGDSPPYEVLKIRKHEINEINFLDFCSFYGSNQCFKFLKANGYEFGDFIQAFSIAGGNIEIIHEIEHSGISYDGFLEYSIQYHHKNISEWLLSNFKCEMISLFTCLEYFDYQFYLFFLLNGANVNECDSNGTLLLYLCQQKNTDIEEIKLLIEKGADVNKRLIHYDEYMDTPLFALLKQKELNFNKINLLLESGANINEIINIDDDCGTILDYFCNQRNVNLEIIKFLLEKGAGFKINGKNASSHFLLRDGTFL